MVDQARGAPRPAALARILIVNDDPSVLAIIRRMLLGRFETVTALGAFEGLEALRPGADPFTAVVVDSQLRGMPGIALLRRIAELAPQTVRLMLTSPNDAAGAIAAVNEGAILRSIAKPCHRDELVAALNAAAEQYRLVTAEKILLEQTVQGCIKALSDVLAIGHPALFARSTRLKRVVAEVSRYVKPPNPWEIEVAALLSQLGYVSLTPEAYESLVDSSTILDASVHGVSRYAMTAAAFVAGIPRLENVHEILLFQDAHFDGAGGPRAGVRGAAIPVGARMLKIAAALDRLEGQGTDAAMAYATLGARPDVYDPQMLAAFIAVKPAGGEVPNVRQLHLRDVRPGMIFAADVRSDTGLLLVARGQEISPALHAQMSQAIIGAVRDRKVSVIVPRTAGTR